MAVDPDNFVHDSKDSFEIDPLNDPAIFAARGTPTGLAKLKGGTPLTNASLTLLGAGEPYGKA